MTGASPRTAASAEMAASSPTSASISAHAPTRGASGASFAARAARFERMAEEGRRVRRCVENDLAAGGEARHVMHVPFTLAMPNVPRQALVVDAAGVGELLGVSERHVRKLDSTGQLPAPIRFGKRTVWAVAELAVWVEAGAPSRDEWEHAKRHPGGGKR